MIGDGADATNSGCPGDSTSLLKELLLVPNIPHGAITFMVDAHAVAEAERVGVGGMFDADVGGRFAPEAGPRTASGSCNLRAGGV